MDTITDILASSARLGSDGRGSLLAPEPLQSWPGIVHGGALIALLDRAAAVLAGATGPRTVEGRLTSSVPTQTALTLEGRADDSTVSLTVLRDGHTLASGTVRTHEGGAEAADGRGWREGWTLPTSEDCLACGARNPLGLRVALRFDGEGVWARLEPRENWRLAGGRLHPALAPVLLDEVAWWLGALVMKEGGLTNRLAVTLLQPDAPFGPVLAEGRFARVSPIDRKRAFWRTETALTTLDGARVATASIVFRGGADYSARQLEYFRARTPSDVFRRMFPNYSH